MNTTLTAPAVAYLLKMYPRFSETFILNEVLELERQGQTVRIFSLKKPNDGRFHADVARVRANVTYLPESLLMAPGTVLRSHRLVFNWDRGRYLRLLTRVLVRRRWTTLKHFLHAGCIAPALRREGITHVHAHFASGTTSVAYYLNQLTGLRYSFTAHAKDIYLEGVHPRHLARKMNAAEFVVTVSDYNRDHLIKLDDGAPRIERIYNGLDLDLFTPNGTKPVVPPLVLAVGRLVEKKGFGDLIRACAILRDEGRRFRCVVVGQGQLAGELRALAREYRLDGVLEFAGALPRERLLGLYPQATVVAAPCVVGSDGNRDGLPTVLIEAMALGTPVVATPVTGIPELVEDERTGLLVPERDPAALARAIGRLLDEPETGATLAKAARARVEERFDLRPNVAHLRALFTASIAAGA